MLRFHRNTNLINSWVTIRVAWSVTSRVTLCWFGLMKIRMSSNYYDLEHILNYSSKILNVSYLWVIIWPIRGLCEKLTRHGATNKTIAECLECHSSTLQESAVLDAGSYPVYGAIGICGYTDTPDVSGDGILIIKDGASVGVTYFADGSYSSIGTLNRLTAKEDINLRYIYYCLKVLNFTPYKTGLAIPHIYFKDYGKHKIWCPPLEQQSSIADALTTIDNKIQVEKSLLEQLNSQKRYMLNQLFI